MNARIFAHRNLNKQRQDRTKYVYTFGSVSGNVGRGKVLGHSDKIEWADMALFDVVDNCQQSTLQKIANGEHRSVAAWLIGTPDQSSELRQPPKLRRFSINPTIGETQFLWSDTKEPVQFPLKEVRLTQSGTYAVIG